MAVCCIPYEHPSVELVSARKEKSVIVRKTEKDNFIIVLTETINRFLSVKVPAHNI